MRLAHLSLATRHSICTPSSDPCSPRLGTDDHSHTRNRSLTLKSHCSLVAPHQPPVHRAVCALLSPPHNLPTASTRHYCATSSPPAPASPLTHAGVRCVASYAHYHRRPNHPEPRHHAAQRTRCPFRRKWTVSERDRLLPYLQHQPRIPSIPIPWLTVRMEPYIRRHREMAYGVSRLKWGQQDSRSLVIAIVKSH